jgi:serine/threonine-protein kinase
MGAASAALSLSLEPHSDGSLRGIETVTMLTNECGTAGKTSAIPIVARRVGDVPTAVVLADPKLFL